MINYFLKVHEDGISYPHDLRSLANNFYSGIELPSSFEGDTEKGIYPLIYKPQPVIKPIETDIPGGVSFNQNTNLITGIESTDFTEYVSVGDTLQILNQKVKVTAVTNNQITVDTNITFSSENICISKYNDQIQFLKIREEVPQLQGDDYVVEYNIVEMTEEERQKKIDDTWNDIRQKRAMQLYFSDWVVTKNVEAGTPVPTEWVTYRQALRDITDQTDPFNITWPIPPV